MRLCVMGGVRVCVSERLRAPRSAGPEQPAGVNGPARRRRQRRRRRGPAAQPGGADRGCARWRRGGPRAGPAPPTGAWNLPESRLSLVENFPESALNLVRVSSESRPSRTWEVGVLPEGAPTGVSGRLDSRPQPAGAPAVQTPAGQDWQLSIYAPCGCIYT